MSTTLNRGVLPSRFFRSLSNNYTSNTNDSTICHPFLLAQGNKSEKGLCDDMTSALVISAIVLFIHTALIVVSIGGLIYKLRKLNTLKKEHKNVVNYLQVARNPPLMIMGALIGWTYTFVLMTRVLIGRKIYPCFIFSLIYYLAVPALSGTVILRCIRLLVLSKLNELKVRIGNRQYDLHATTSSENMKHMLEANTTIVPITTPWPNVHDSQPSVENPSHNACETTSSSSEVRKSTHLSTFVSSGSPIENLETNNIVFRNKTILETIEEKLLFAFRFIVGTRFVFACYTAIVALHLLIYYIISIVDYFKYQNGEIESSQIRFNFAMYSFLLSPSGCGTGSYSQYVFISFASFYVAIGLFTSVVALLTTKRDVWNVKIEVVIINIFWVLVIIIYGVASQFSIINSYVDYYFPWTITILIGCMWDTLISFTYPVFGLQRFKSEKSTQNNGESQSRSEIVLNDASPAVSSSNNIYKILTNEKWNKLFLNFSEKCFACEDVMMWNAVEKFRSISSEKQRRELFYNICNTYIRVGAPLELNISRKDFDIPEIVQIYESLREATTTQNTDKNSPSRLFSITPDIFNKIQTACEHNMLDNYKRFQSSYEKQLEKELAITSKPFLP